ncbi:hypothetical protein SmJEL517_g00280 [Synchytrium microbalum]|uniref:Histone H4 n=43 Tax=Eukaryota TaxID=2759 RepID=A0A507CB40_9FUNG|nr:uncharacterized protein SmJEL517_g00280 [Synchytrium microbalum]TPX38277.1 hypothetical protein SmJEL517_g00280 [Synchytrium microbalum]
MSGRGKGGKGLGKGGAKRHRKILRDNIQGITKPAIRRLARRGGVKRISGLIYEETRGVLKVFLENVIRDAVTYTEHAKRKTVTSLDVVYALKRQGRTLYGFGGSFGATSCTVTGSRVGCTSVPADGACVCDCCAGSNTCAQLFSGCSSNATKAAGYSGLTPSGPYIWTSGVAIFPIMIAAPGSPTGNLLASAPCISPDLPTGLSFVFNASVQSYQIQGTPQASVAIASYSIILIHTSDVLSAITAQAQVLAGTGIPSPSASIAVSPSLVASPSGSPTRSQTLPAASPSASGLPLPSTSSSSTPLASSSGSNVPIGAVIGGVLAAIVAVIIAGILCLVFGRRNGLMAATGNRPSGGGRSGYRPPVGKVMVPSDVELDGYANPIYAMPQTFPNTNHNNNGNMSRQRPASVVTAPLLSDSEGGSSSGYSTQPQPLRRVGHYSTAPRVAGGTQNVQPQPIQYATQPRVNTQQQNLGVGSSQQPLSAVSDAPPPAYQATQKGPSNTQVLAGETLMVCALAYTPRRDDEMELAVNDRVTVVEQYGDGWSYGINQRTGKQGFLPMNAMVPAVSTAAVNSVQGITYSNKALYTNTATGTAMPDVRDHTCGVDPDGAGKVAYCFGGTSTGQLPDRPVYAAGSLWALRFDVATSPSGIWTQQALTGVADVLVGRGMHSMTFLSSRIYVFGGKDSNGTAIAGNGQFITINPTTLATTTVGASGTAPTARYDHCAVRIGSTSMMVLFGTSKLNAASATTPTNALNDAYIYDATANSWSKVAYTGTTQPSVRSGARCAFLNNKIYVFGGQTDSNNVLGDTWYLDLSSNAWTQVVATNAPYARVGHAGAAVGVWMAVYGGNPAATATNGDTNIHFLDARTNAWQAVAPNFTVSGALVTFPSLTPSPGLLISSPYASATAVAAAASTSGSGLSTATIIGAAVSGAVVLAAIVAAMAYAFYRLRKLRGSDEDVRRDSKIGGVNQWRESVRPSFGGTSTMSERGGGGGTYSRDSDFSASLLGKAAPPLPPARSANPTRTTALGNTPPSLVAINPMMGGAGAAPSFQQQQQQNRDQLFQQNRDMLFQQQQQNQQYQHHVMPPQQQPAFQQQQQLLSPQQQHEALREQQQRELQLQQEKVLQQQREQQQREQLQREQQQQVFLAHQQPPSSHHIVPQQPFIIAPPPQLMQRPIAPEPPTNTNINNTPLGIPSYLRPISTATTITSLGGSSATSVDDRGGASALRQELSHVYDMAALDVNTSGGNNSSKIMRPDSQATSIATASRPVSFGSTADERPTHSAIAQYAPTMEDELALEVGDLVVLTAVFDDGWGVAVNQRTSRVGTVPVNYLAPLPK